MATRAQTIPAAISETTSVLISRQLVYSCVLWLLAVCMMAMFCQTAAGQDARIDQAYEIVDEKWRVVPLRPGATSKQAAQHRKLYLQATKNIRASAKSARDTMTGGGNIATLTPFFLGHVFPMMRVKDETIVSDLGQVRADYIKDYLGPKVTGKIRSDLITLTVTEMQKIQSSASLHPAHRLSAVYLIGILDETPASRLEERTPVPARAALAALWGILNSQDAGTPDYLKIAAIWGIQRHLEIDKLVGGGQISSDQKIALNQVCTQLLNSKEDTPVAYWLKRRSMQAMGLIGEPSSAAIAVSVLKSDAGMPLKLDAVVALQRIPTGSLGAQKNLAAAVAVSDFASVAIKTEKKNIEARVGKIVYDVILQQNVDLLANPVDYQEQVEAAAGSDTRPDFGGGAPFGGARGAVAADDDFEKPQFELPGYHLNLIRRQIKSVAYLSSQTLGGDNGELGLKQYVADEGKAFIGGVISELEDLLAQSNAGIIDLDNPPEELEPGEEPLGTATHQLTELCKDSSKNLARLLRKQRGEPEPVEKASTPSASAVNPLAGGAPAAAVNPLGGDAPAAAVNPLGGGAPAEAVNPLGGAVNPLVPGN